MAEAKERKEAADNAEEYPTREAQRRFERAVDIAVVTKATHIIKPAKTKPKPKRRR